MKKDIYEEFRKMGGSTLHFGTDTKLNALNRAYDYDMGTNLLFELGEDLRVAHILHRKSG